MKALSQSENVVVKISGLFMRGNPGDKYLEEVIMYEGPDKIAAMFVETVTGTNGILPPPKGYM